MTDEKLKKLKELRERIVNTKQQLEKAIIASDDKGIRLNTDAHQNLYLHVPQELTNTIFVLIVSTLKAKVETLEKEFENA